MFFSAQLVTHAVHRVQEICFTRTKRIYKIAQVHGNEIEVNLLSTCMEVFYSISARLSTPLELLTVIFLTIILYKAVQLKLLKDINSTAVCP